MPDSILVIAAHPDDVDFGAAGSIARWAQEGSQVSYCIVTDGDAGGFDVEADRSAIPALRRAEQRAAGAVLGVVDMRFLGYPDGRLQATVELRRDISRVIREVRPDRVVCPCPERLWERVRASHPDHLAAGEAALCAVYPDSRNPFAHPELLAEGFAPHAVGEVWMMAAPQADVFVDVTDQLPLKLAALRCHESQITNPAGLEEMIRQWGAHTARQGGLPGGRLAEAFRRVVTA